MALALVQSAGSTSASASTTTTFSAATASNLLVGVATTDTLTGAISDLTANTAGWSVAHGFKGAAGSESVRFFYKVAAGGETSLQVTGTGANVTSLEVMEFSGFAGWIIDRTGTNDQSGAGTTCATGTTGTLTTAVELAIAGIGCSGNVSGESWDSSFNVVSHVNGNIVAGYKFTAATTALNPTASWTTSRDRVGAIVTFQELISVDSDLDLRWNQNANVTSDLDLRWALGGTLDSDLNLRWAVQGPVGSFRVRTEVAWDTDPLTRPADVDFDELAVGVRNLNIRRGTKILSSGLEAGTATCQADNSDRSLDPSNAASPLYPNVKPRKRIRFIVEVGGSEVTLFTGFAERWPIEWSVESGWVTVTASDLFNIIASLRLPPSVLDVTMRELAPVSYWPMTETVFTEQADDVIGNFNGQYTGTVDAGKQIVPFDARPNPKFAQDTNEIATTAMYAPRPSFSDEITLVAWIAQPPVDVAGIFNPIVVELVDQSTPYSPPAGDVFNPAPAAITLIVDPGGISGRHTLSVRVQDGTTAGKMKGLVDYLMFDGKAHLIAAKIKASTKAIQVSIDGDNFFTPTNVGGSYSNITSVNFTTAFNNAEILAAGWGIRVQALPTVPLEGIVGHVALFDRLISDAEIEDIYEAGTVAWDGDLTGARANRILDLVGIDTDDRDIDTGTQTCGPTLLGSDNALAYLKKLTATEGGACFVNGDGMIRFTDRIPDSPATVQIFSDRPDIDGGAPYGPVSPDYSWDRIINTVVIGRENDADQTIVNQPSVDAYGPASGATGGKIETLHQDATDARATGERIVERHGEPRVYIPSVTLNTADQGVPLEAVTGPDIGDGTELYARPAGGGAAIEQDALVEALEHRFPRANEWTVTYSLAEYPPP